MTNRTWRRGAALVALAVPLAFTPIAALGWAEAAHVFMAKHTDKAAGRLEPGAVCNRLYGSVAVDMFAYDFSVEGQTLHAILHDRTMAVSALAAPLAANAAERGFAYGLASHNNVWGTDATAHFDGVTEGNRNGYVIAKAALLASVPQFRGAVLPLVGNDEETLLLVSHILIEYSIDLLVARADPAIGADLVAAALGCDPAPSTDLLVKAWVPVFSNWVAPEVAEAKLRAADPAYRWWLAGYGTALQQPQAQQLVAGAVANVAIDFLRLPREVLPGLTVLIDGALGVGQQLVAADFQAELDATIGRVNAELSALKIAP